MDKVTTKVDELDRRIMALLRADGRVAYKTIAAEVSLSETAVRHRVARLLREKVFRISTVMSPYDLGLVGANVEVRARSGRLRAVTEAIAEIPETDWVAIVSGTWNVSVELFCPDHAAIFACQERIESIQGVEETRLSVHLHVVKHTLSF